MTLFSNAEQIPIPTGDKMVLLESPYAGATENVICRHVIYARMAMRDSFFRGEAPFASHLLYTQSLILSDGIPAERELGIAAGLLWGAKAVKTVVYTDLGTSSGMARGISEAVFIGRPVEYRTLPKTSLDMIDSIMRLSKNGRL